MCVLACDSGVLSISTINLCALYQKHPFSRSANLIDIFFFKICTFALISSALCIYATCQKILRETVHSDSPHSVPITHADLKWGSSNNNIYHYADDK